MTGFLSFSGISPADEGDDRLVFQLGISCTLTSPFVHQFQNLIFVRELLAHLTAAHRRAGVTDANSYNKDRRFGLETTQQTCQTAAKSESAR